MPTFFCKAILDRPETKPYGEEWRTSTRCLLKVSDHSLAAAGVTIPFSEMRRCHLRVVPSLFGLTACVLTVHTEQTTHHFGMNYSKFWRGDLPFEVTREAIERTPPKLTSFSGWQTPRVMWLILVIDVIVAWILFRLYLV